MPLSDTDPRGCASGCSWTMKARPPHPEPRILFTVDEAAAELRIARATFYRLLGSGEIESIHIGRRRLVPKEAIDAWLAAKRGRAQ